MSEWLYNGNKLDQAPEDVFGFVYCITNNMTGQRYIGKKQFWSHRSKKVAGRRNRKHYTKEADWREYWSSCDELKEDVHTIGDSKFTREILRMCKTKGELTYSEVEYQIKMDVLTSKLPNGQPAFYNRNIMNRWFAKADTLCESAGTQD